MKSTVIYHSQSTFPLASSCYFYLSQHAEALNERDREAREAGQRAHDQGAPVRPARRQDPHQGRRRKLRGPRRREISSRIYAHYKWRIGGATQSSSRMSRDRDRDSGCDRRDRDRGMLTIGGAECNMMLAMDKRKRHMPNMCINFTYVCM